MSTFVQSIVEKGGKKGVSTREKASFVSGEGKKYMLRCKNVGVPLEHEGKCRHHRSCWSLFEASAGQGPLKRMKNKDKKREKEAKEKKKKSRRPVIVKIQLNRQLNEIIEKPGVGE